MAFKQVTCNVGLYLSKNWNEELVLSPDDDDDDDNDTLSIYMVFRSAT